MAAKGKKAGQNTILVAFVLDKSGSMDAVREATISGFNEYRGDQARSEGAVLMSLTMFDTEFRHVCDAVPVAEVTDLTCETYEPGGCTALYDAIAHAIKGVDRHIEIADKRPDRVLVVIMTDGEENSSREFDRERIFRMIEDRQDNRGYEFVYLGANQDSYVAGRGIGVREGHMLNVRHDAQGHERAWRRLSRASDELMCYSEPCMPADWLAPDELLEEEGDDASGGRAGKQPKA